jgi:hypothetical protein
LLLCARGCGGQEELFFNFGNYRDLGAAVFA